jgi:hypothetical protein
MGARLGILESGNKNDMLHTLVYNHTKKTSIRELTEQEYKAVVKDLAQQLNIQHLEEPVHPYKKQKREQSGVGMMSDGQQRKVWQLMYELKQYDKEPSAAPLGERLCGIIRKELHIDVTTKQPFRWLTFKQGAILIEKLKKYVANAQRRKDGAETGN